VLRLSETLLVVYFAYTAVLAIRLPVSPEIARVTVTLNALVIGGFFLLAKVDALRRREFLSIVRDWYPMPLMLLAYRQMGWFALPRQTFDLEQGWVRWDRLLLNQWGLKQTIESLGPLLPVVLEVSYLLVYTIVPFSIAVLYAYHRRERVDDFLFTFLLGILISYSLFPYFPSEPPRTVFPGEDLPSMPSIVRRFTLWLLGGYGIHTSVFPSAHVSGAFTAAFAMIRVLPEHPWAGRFLLVLAVLIATATVYGRYHYAVDGVAGFGVAIAAFLLGTWASRRRKWGRL
jgi:membrane-associated phospholipid phosphatase